jgi:hypothetical protein
MSSRGQRILPIVLATLLGFSPICSYAADAVEKVVPLKTDPLKPGSVTPYQVESVTATEDVPNADYDSLPRCDKKTINCKDMNGALAQNNIEEYCPNVCTTSDEITEKYVLSGGTMIPSTTSVAGYKPAKCPSGYSASSGYAYAKEIIYVDSNQVFPFPIPDKATYDAYMKIPGTTCAADPKNTGTFEYCAKNSPNHPVGKMDVYGTVIFPLTNRVISPGVYGIITADGRTSKCYDQYTCPGPSTLSCSLPTTKRLYKPTYAYLKCARSPGFYYTDKFAPSAKVCVRSYTQWKKTTATPTK